jgi:hypothetical protein
VRRGQLTGGPASAERAVDKKENGPSSGEAEAAVWGMPVPLGGDGTD